MKLLSFNSKYYKDSNTDRLTQL